MRIVLCLFMVQGFAFHAFAQVEYGITAGLNVSDVVLNNYLDPDAESDYDPKAGIHAGLFAAADVAERLRMTGALMYSNQGVRAISRISLHYVTVPVTLRYKMTKSIFAGGGPQLGYLFAAKSPYGDVSNIWNNKLDIGLTAVAEAMIFRGVSASLGYYAGFSSVIDDRDNSGGSSIRYQNRVLQLSLGFRVGDLGSAGR